MDGDGEASDRVELPDEPMPLCPPHLAVACSSDGISVQSDSGRCPLCDRDTYGSFLLCGYCATDAGVCVFDAVPIDGSGDEPTSWLAHLKSTREAGWDAIPRLSPDARRRWERARHLGGIWHSDVTRLSTAASDCHLVLEGDFTGLLAFSAWGRLTALSRFRWSLDDDRFSASPWPLAKLPAGTWEEPLTIGSTHVVVTTGGRQEAMLFAEQPAALTSTGWLLHRVEPHRDAAPELWAILRGPG